MRGRDRALKHRRTSAYRMPAERRDENDAPQRNRLLQFRARSDVRHGPFTINRLSKGKRIVIQLTVRDGISEGDCHFCAKFDNSRRGIRNRGGVLSRVRVTQTFAGSKKYAEEVPLQWFRVAKYNYSTRGPLESIKNDVKSVARKAARASLPPLT